MHKYCLGYIGLFSKTYLFDCFTGVLFTEFVCFMVHPGCLTWFGRGYGTMVGYRTFGADCYGQRSRPLVIPLSFQAFLLSLFVTFGLAFANPSASQPSDPEVLASS